MSILTDQEEFSYIRLRTQRLTLRRPKPDDATWIADLANDYDVAKSTASLPHPYTFEDARDFLMKTAHDWDSGCGFSFVIEAKRPMGLIGLHRKGEHQVEFGYWLGSAFWGSGYATEAARETVRFGFGDLGLEVIEAGYFTDNERSARVLEKTGFRDAGLEVSIFCRARDRNVMARRVILQRSDWQGLNGAAS